MRREAWGGVSSEHVFSSEQGLKILASSEHHGGSGGRSPPGKVGGLGGGAPQEKLGGLGGEAPQENVCDGRSPN